MKHDILKYARVALFAALAWLAAAVPVDAQVVTQLPIYLDNSGVVYDFGNGPLEIRMLQGNAGIFTSQGSGVGSGTTTTITLTATPTVPPCVGCAISGGTLIASSIVTAFNGTTTITTNTSQTVAASTPLAWGAACPTSSVGNRVMLLQPGQPPTADIPIYTLARICGGAQFTAGATVIPFPIGAH